MARTYLVGFAQARPEGPWGTVASGVREALEASWRPGVVVTRYGRTWRLARSHRLTDDLWAGNMGFIREREFRAVFYDETEAEFRLSDAPGGVVVPFVFDIQRALVGFQLRSGLVRPTTFTGALAGLLSTASSHEWDVRPLVQELEYDEWRRSIQRLTQARFRLVRPNPNYADRGEVRHLIEDLETTGESRPRIGGWPEDTDGDGSISDAGDERIPALIKTAGDHAVSGYVRYGDLEGPQPSNPAEAVAISGEERVIPVYAADGITVVDWYTISSGGREPSPSPDTSGAGG